MQHPGLYCSYWPLVGRTPWSAGDPLGRPPRARPSILARFLHQPCPHRIPLDVIPDLLELPLMPHQVVIAFFLPKGLPVNASIALARLAVMPFNDFVSFGNATAGVASK